MGVDAVPNLELKPIPIYRDNGFSEGPEKNRPDYERASMSYPWNMETWTTALQTCLSLNQKNSLNTDFFLRTNNDFIALIFAVNNLLGIQLLPSIPSC